MTINIIITFSIATLVLLSSPSFAENRNFGLEKLQRDKDFDSGCSCSVTNSKDEFLVVSDLQEKAPAIVRINGKKMELKLISSTEKTGRPKNGDTFTRVYGSANIKLSMHYKTNFVCEKDDESCEVIRYSVDTVLKRGSENSELKNMKGDCGC